uniref:Tetratricopeptide repeat protein 5-like n=1 Tax=Hirondellea gigas TaxID=1518452 RepID=A0A6A7G416_9CRUS
MSMLMRSEPTSTPEKREENINKGVEYARRAVKQDPADGRSWMVLGNALLSAFFALTSNTTTLQACKAAYARAEQDKKASMLPELHYSKYQVAWYEESYTGALRSLYTAWQLEPSWSDCENKRVQSCNFLRSLHTLIKTKGHLSNKRLQTLIKNIKSSQLGPYEQTGTVMSGNKKPQLVNFQQLQHNTNTDKIVQGMVVSTLVPESGIPFVMCLVDAEGTCLPVTVYNWAQGAEVKIGDAVAVVAPVLKEQTVELGVQQQEVLSPVAFSAANKASVGATKSAAVASVGAIKSDTADFVGDEKSARPVSVGATKSTTADVPTVTAADATAVSDVSTVAEENVKEEDNAKSAESHVTATIDVGVSKTEDEKLTKDDERHKDETENQNKNGSTEPESDGAVKEKSDHGTTSVEYLEKVKSRSFNTESTNEEGLKTNNDCKIGVSLDDPVKMEGVANINKDSLPKSTVEQDSTTNKKDNSGEQIIENKIPESDSRNTRKEAKLITSKIDTNLRKVDKNMRLNPTLPKKVISNKDRDTLTEKKNCPTSRKSVPISNVMDKSKKVIKPSDSRVSKHNTLNYAKNTSAKLSDKYIDTKSRLNSNVKKQINAKNISEDTSKTSLLSNSKTVPPKASDKLNKKSSDCDRLPSNNIISNKSTSNSESTTKNTGKEDGSTNVKRIITSPSAKVGSIDAFNRKRSSKLEAKNTNNKTSGNNIKKSVNANKRTSNSSNSSSSASNRMTVSGGSGEKAAVEENVFVLRSIRVVAPVMLVVNKRVVAAGQVAASYIVSQNKPE